MGFDIPASDQNTSPHAYYNFPRRASHRISPGFLDIQINGAYGFDFSVYEGDDEAYTDGLKTVTEKIVETGVTSYVIFLTYLPAFPT